MDLLIREVRPDDAEAIVGILNPLIEAGTQTVFYTPLTVEFERGYIVNFPSHGVFCVAECRQARRVVGF